MKKLLLVSISFLMLAAPAFAETATGNNPPAGVAPAGVENAPKAELKARRESALAKLPPAKAELVRSTMKKLREESKTTIEKIGALQEEMLTIVKAPKFDRGVYLAKAKEVRTFSIAQSEKRAGALADLAGQLTVEERNSIAGMFGVEHKAVRKNKDKIQPEKNG